MNKTTFYKSLITSLFLFFLFFANLTVAQVGIGTVTPDATAVLDVSSTTQGMLTPRMTTTQRNAITTPANGLMVYDTTLKSFYYYDTTITAWVSMNAATSYGRLNFKRIKSTDVLATVLAAEKSAGGGLAYKLDTNTLYEINGTINVDLPIDLNNAYIAGLDTNEDKLVKAGGTLFTGSGGSIKSVTLQATGGTVFALSGTAADSFVFRDAIVVSSASVGTISGFGLVFSSIVQYAGNGAGVTYTNISKLLLSNIGWFAGNSGTYEKLTGTFGLVQKQGGFSEVSGAATAFDVSTFGLAVGVGILGGTVFSGTTTAPDGYVKGYAAAQTYLGYNFSNVWNVDSPGIPKESDDVATGNLYYDSSSIINISSTAAFKLPVNTNSIRLFRTAEGAGVNSENRLIYKGEGRRALNVLGALSFTATSGSRYTFSIYKNGGIVVGSEVDVDVTTTNARQSVSIIGTVDVVKNDYIEIYVKKTTSGNEQFLMTSYNLIFN
ncbi:hypothetical protein HNQ02_000157 [Flavobacterium sp. 7E]|uniref:hypothetical protein n=1 Tax=Flavobacterium sp. 7E TaxID=2735898 RepID=UPI0020C70491|nr:hypothetical protein [Flavobacterium sp. 7E]NRS87257.1 hypothetical protein [Flavobacterium sp. 7E]